MEKGIVDNYLEHEFHTEYDSHCSECFLKNGKVNSNDWKLLYPDGKNEHAISRSDITTNRNPLE